MFLNVTIFHILKNENYELCFSAGFFVDEIMIGKNYDRKKKVLCWFIWFCGEIVFGIIYILSVQYSSKYFCCCFRHIWAASKTIRWKIMWSQFLPNLSRYSCVVVSVFLLWFPPNLSCLQNNPPENNVEPFPPNLSCLQNNPPQNNVEDLAGTRLTLFSSGLFWDWFLLDLRSFFGAHFRYKLMCYYFYHRSD